MNVCVEEIMENGRKDFYGERKDDLIYDLEKRNDVVG
jgi:hypothetical protein